MSDDPPMEGWNISSWRVLAVLATILIVLSLVLTLTERRYLATIEPTRHRPIHHFPTPNLDGFDDPARPTPIPPPGAAPPLGNTALGTAAARGNALLQDAPK